METKITNNNFETEVLKESKLVLIDFWATWCGPCRMLGPIVEELSEKHNEIKVCKVNVDEEEDLARKFRVSSIPMLVLMKDGKIIKTTVGYMNYNSLEEFIK